MTKIDLAASELREMDELAAMVSPVHSLHPLPKLVVAVSYIIVTVSFNKYNLSGLTVMILYPALMFQLSGVPIRSCFRKLRIILPLVCAVGLFNPFFDRTPLMHLGPLSVSGGTVSMITLMLKGILCLTASFILAATTPMDSICAALRKLHIPKALVTLLLLTYRYITVMIEEVSIMTEAYRLRAPGQKGIHYSAWGSFLGQLLLRSMDRAEEIYSSMQLRGFCGEFHYADVNPAKFRDYAFCFGLLAAFAFCRSFNVAELLGGIVLGGAS